MFLPKRLVAGGMVVHLGDIIAADSSAAVDIGAPEDVIIENGVLTADMIVSSRQIVASDAAVAGHIAQQMNLCVLSNEAGVNDHDVLTGNMVVFADRHGVSAIRHIREGIARGIALDRCGISRDCLPLQGQSNHNIIGIAAKAGNHASQGRRVVTFAAIHAVAAIAFAGIDHGEALQTFGAMLTGIGGAFIAHLT